MEYSEKILKQYMVEFSIAQPITDEMMAMIPEQREAVEELFVAGQLLSYSLSMDRSRLWALMLADTESELMSLIDTLPLSDYMDFDYKELMFHNAAHLMPAMSLN